MEGADLIQSGKLDTPIDVYYYANTQNDYGEISQTRTFLKQVWAELVPAGKGTEKVQDETIVASSFVNFLVRYDSAYYMDSATISPENYFCIKYDNKYWDISSMEKQGRGKGILIRTYFFDNGGQ